MYLESSITQSIYIKYGDKINKRNDLTKIKKIWPYGNIMKIFFNSLVQIKL